MKISKSAVIQYVLIYLMMVFNGGVLYPALQASMPRVITFTTYAIVGFGIALFFLKKRKYGNPYCMGISIILLYCIILVRFAVGGVGITALLEYLVGIMLAFLAICIDKRSFTTRVINAVYCIAAISIVCYLIQIIKPDLLKMCLRPFQSTFGYNDWSGGSAVSVSYTAWGKLFFTMRDGEMSRNLGIFTEPGNYQIVLNSTLFLLMFLPGLYVFKQNQLKRRFIVIVVALLTCQSTSGYLIFLALCIAFFVSKGHYKDMFWGRRIITVFIFAALGILVVDYYIRENESLLNVAVFSKLFSDGSIDVSASTGYWRLATIGSSIALMIAHPFGVGFDTTLSTIQNQLAGSAGGALMIFGAALGIIPFIATIVWFVGPIVKDKRLDIPAKIAFMIMYFQTSFAQSKVFYPFIVSIILILVITKNDVSYNVKQKKSRDLKTE